MEIYEHGFDHEFRSLVNKILKTKAYDLDEDDLDQEDEDIDKKLSYTFFINNIYIRVVVFIDILKAEYFENDEQYTVLNCVCYDLVFKSYRTFSLKIEYKCSLEQDTRYLILPQYTINIEDAHFFQFNLVDSNNYLLEDIIEEFVDANMSKTNIEFLIYFSNKYNTVFSISFIKHFKKCIIQHNIRKNIFYRLCCNLCFINCCNCNCKSVRSYNSKLTCSIIKNE